METKNLSQEFVDYQYKLRLLLADSFEANRLKLEDLMSILDLLSGQENLGDFRASVELFSKNFPVLKEFLDKENENFTESNEQKLSVLTQKLIKAGKTELVNKINEEKEDKALTSLLEKFPEIKNYI